MSKFFFEDLNKVNYKYFSEYVNSLKKIFKKESFILGNNVKKFEKNFSRYVKTNYCISVNSGLDALFFSLKALNLQKGAEIILPANAYIAAVFAILNAGLKPVFVEPKIDTYNIDPSLILKKITKKTKAILVVHLYGKPCEMDKILIICKQNKIFLIEDCAQSHGAMYKEKFTGTFGDFGCFSFYPTKNLGSIGDAGAIIVKTKKNLNFIKKIRNYGSNIKNIHESIGYNSRLDEIQAAFLNIKLRYLNEINNHKRKLAKVYLENLNDKFIKPVTQKDIVDVFHIFTIRFYDRKKLQNYLNSNGVDTIIHYPTPPYSQPFFNNNIAEKFPISNLIHKTIISLPISTNLKETDILKITKIINKF